MQAQNLVTMGDLLIMPRQINRDIQFFEIRFLIAPVMIGNGRHGLGKKRLIFGFSPFIADNLTIGIDNPHPAGRRQVGFINHILMHPVWRKNFVTGFNPI